MQINPTDVHFRWFFKLAFYFLIPVMYYSNTPRHKWTALDVIVEEIDPTPPQIYPLRQQIELFKIELQQWDVLQMKLIVDHKTITTKKDFIKWKIRSLEHEIALYICALTDPVKEGDWDQPTMRIIKLEKNGYI